MVLDLTTIEKIKGLVYQKPQSINSIALALGKNWRTADRYVEEIKKKTGTIKTMTFREGTRGALKIVYWNNTEKIYSTDIQEELFKKIELGINKSDFSPFEIYQYVDPQKREGFYEEIKHEKNYNYRIEDLIPYIETSEKEISIFAGNLAFIHLEHNKRKIIDYIHDAIQRGVLIKVISSINLVDLKNIELLLSLNQGLREPLVEIRHSIIPLRGYIFDTKILRLGEVAYGQKKEGQVQNTIANYYEIRDEMWVEWIEKLFWKKFQQAIPAKKRLEHINSLKKL